MKITRVEAIPLRIPVNFSSIGVDLDETASFTYVEVETDSGLIGHGLTSITQARPVAEAVNSVLAPAIIGLDALAHERVWHVMAWTATPWAQSGYASHAISAVDLALWDIKGKAFGQPVWRLMGGARDKVPVYATCGFSFLDDDHLAEVATRVAGQGFKGLKIQVGRPGLDTRKNPLPVGEIIASDVRRIRGVRAASMPAAASICPVRRRSAARWKTRISPFSRNPSSRTMFRCWRSYGKRRPYRSPPGRTKGRPTVSAICCWPVRSTWYSPT